MTDIRSASKYESRALKKTAENDSEQNGCEEECPAMITGGTRIEMREQRHCESHIDEIADA